MNYSNELHPCLMASPDDILVAKSWINKYEWYKEIFEEQKLKMDEFVKKTPVYVSPVKQTYQYKMYNCPNHDVELLYEEDYPHEHHCPIDSTEVFRGFKYDSAWSGWYNRKLAVKLVWLGLLYNVYGDRKYAEAGKDILMQFADLYLKYPVENTILGPAHVFFGTLSESFWGVDMAYGYDLLYNYDGFSDEDREVIKNDFFYPLANITQQFPESASNRQTWYNNVSAAVGFLYKDEKLIDFAMKGKYGFTWQLGSALPESGFWGEGPGYHFVTLRGMIHFAEMCTRNGIDLYNLEVNGRTMKLLFDAPFNLIKPNYEFPRIKDSGGGNLLDYSTFYDVGYSVYGDKKYLAVINFSKLKRGFQVVGEESGKGERETPITLFQIKPDLPDYSEDIYSSGSSHIKGMGLAVLKSGTEENRKYLMLDYGIVGGEHGHPDRLQFEYYAGGKNWIVDPLNESYFNPNLQTWFRQTIAHNTIVIDQTSQAWANGELNFYGDTSLFQAVSGNSNKIYPGARVDRTLLQVDEYFIDLMDVECDEERIIDYPIHSFGKLEVSNVKMEAAPLDYFGVTPGIPGYDQFHDIHLGVTDKPSGFIFYDENSGGMQVESLSDGVRTVFSGINPPIGGFYKQMITEQKPQPMFMIRKKSKSANFANLFHVFDSDLQVISFKRIDKVNYSVSFPGFSDTLHADVEKSTYSVIRMNGSTAQFAAGFNIDKIEYKNKIFFTSKIRLSKIQFKYEGDTLLIETGNYFGEIKILNYKIRSVILNGKESKFITEGKYVVIKEPNPLTLDFSVMDRRVFRGKTNNIKVNLYNNSGEDKSVNVKIRMRNNWKEKIKNQVEWWGGIVNLIPDNIKAPLATKKPVDKIIPLKLSTDSRDYKIKAGTKTGIKIKVEIPAESASASYPFEILINDNCYEFDLEVQDPIDVDLSLPNLKKNQMLLMLTNNTKEKLSCTVFLDGLKNWDIKKRKISISLLPGKKSSFALAAELKGYNSKQQYPVGIKLQSGDLLVEKIKHFTIAKARFADDLPSLSGDWKGWDKREPVRINRGDQVCKLLMGNQKWNGPDDLSGEVYIMYDKEYLYIGVNVIDDVVVSHWNYPEMSYPWDTDSIEFIIDARSGSDQCVDPPTPGLWRHLMIAEYRKTDFAHWRFGSAGGPTLPKPNLFRDAETYYQKTKNGYSMICRIPVISMNMKKLEKGMKLGFDIAINDNDGTSFRKNTHIWSGYTQNQVWWVIESIGVLIID